MKRALKTKGKDRKDKVKGNERNEYKGVTGISNKGGNLASISYITSLEVHESRFHFQLNFKFHRENFILVYPPPLFSLRFLLLVVEFFTFQAYSSIDFFSGVTWLVTEHKAFSQPIVMFSCDFVIDSTFLATKILNFLCIDSLSPFLLSLTTIKLVEIPIFARFNCWYLEDFIGYWIV